MPAKTSLPVQITLTVEQDDSPVRGNAVASGDGDADREVEDEILARLDSGDVWAWAFVAVTATLNVEGQTFIGRDTLGCCCYRDEAEFRADAYFSDMKTEAMRDLHNTIQGAIRRGTVASDALATFY